MEWAYGLGSGRACTPTDRTAHPVQVNVSSRVQTRRARIAIVELRHGFLGSTLAGRLPTGQVLTRSTPPSQEGCRPASRGLALALMTCAGG
ncbi:hypothetical protein MLP_47810 [Microlunatus phosphovorus NM-1]|uniref:Uncharacterized protein n=1 Tax=Microlunatus phosphovorus (strain ATCC 700054 / DSM 10555 / JCM 9379 / NBRC 101784 / NCIMB 13414 / VKM Ac-1990 / NM-1) TaxID=1032480 RepID=F5XF57_MICPN|nr:hypothetical protein MLP_47810 [Microlunatus phosphovorus NM-1]